MKSQPFLQRTRPRICEHKPRSAADFLLSQATATDFPAPQSKCSLGTPAFPNKNHHQEFYYKWALMHHFQGRKKKGQVVIQKPEIPTASCLLQQKYLTLLLSNVENSIHLEFEKVTVNQNLSYILLFFFSILFFVLLSQFGSYFSSPKKLSLEIP